MAPPPLSDLLDWRVPYVPLFAMISVSFVYACDLSADGLRAPPSSGPLGPAAMASGVTTSAASSAAASRSGCRRNADRIRGFTSVVIGFKGRRRATDDGR